jgi:hypothetical protein
MSPASSSGRHDGVIAAGLGHRKCVLNDFLITFDRQAVLRPFTMTKTA